MLMQKSNGFRINCSGTQAQERILCAVRDDSKRELGGLEVAGRVDSGWNTVR